jgi:hypothetical protein
MKFMKVKKKDLNLLVIILKKLKIMKYRQMFKLLEIFI